jgi:RNA polymerase sigma-70 factor (subfamily 1)
MQASDIVQLTMARMIVGFADFRGSTSAEFYSWLNAILKNEVLTLNRDMHRHRRDVRREQPLEEGGPEFAKALNQESPETVLLRNEKLKRFREVVKHLPSDYATIIELRGLREMPFKEVAESMNRSVDAVTKLWTRALVKLSDELAKLDESIS